MRRLEVIHAVKRICDAITSSGLQSALQSVVGRHERSAGEKEGIKQKIFTILIK